MPETLRLPLDRPALPVDVPPGGEIVLRGAFVSTHDGATIDAATTTWPGDAPGGPSVDAGGLVDLEAGGFHLTSRDPVTHEVHAVATGDPAPACAALGATAPCLPLRLVPQARTRLLTVGDWSSSLKGGITVESPQTLVPPVPPSVWPYVAGLASALGLVGAALVALRVRRRHAESPRGRLLALVRRVEGRLRHADQGLAAPLRPAVDAALEALRERRVDPASPQGLRVADVLTRVEERLASSVREEREQKEQEAADELVREVEDALAAAEEVRALGRRV
jgi:hypothetical protein